MHARFLILAASIMLFGAPIAASGEAAAAEGGEPVSGGPVVRRDTPSGYPVPRFVALADGPGNCRSGPSMKHPVRYVFQRSGEPLLVVAESMDHWRKVRDADGDECWAYHSILKTPSHVRTLDETTLSAHAGGHGPTRGRIGGGVLAKVRKSRQTKYDGLWVLVEAGPVRGWVPSSVLWGVEPERAAAHTLIRSAANRAPAD